MDFLSYFVFLTNSFHRALKKRAYGALLSKVFQDATKDSPLGQSATRSTPPRNKVLMMCFDLRVAGCREEAEALEEQLGMLPDGASSGLKEVDAVLELLVFLAGSAPPPIASFNRDYMRRERPVLRRPQPWSYQSEELQRLEARAWGLVCGEEWGTLESLCAAQRLMDAPPGTGLLALRTKLDTEEKFEKETRLSLFGALQHTRTSDMDIRLDIPPVPSNVDVTGLAIRVPHCLDQSEDEGFQSASNLTPDSQSEPSSVPDFDMWEALRTFEPGRRRCWESVGCPPGKHESLYLTEGGREAFDQLYRLWEGQMRVVSMNTPSPILPLPLDSQTQLVSDLLNVLIGVASSTFPLNQNVQFDVRPGVCISGASAESVSRLLGELAQYGTYYLRLSRFSLQSADKKGLVFQVCLSPLLSLKLRYLSELCSSFPVVSSLLFLLSYLYNEAQNNCSNENYPVLLSLLKSSCAPYTRFVSDWVYNGLFRDVYGEFMIQVNEEYLNFRDKHFWSQGYTLISKDVEDCVPIFLKHIANDVYVCGKTINLLKICCPQHYICWSELPAPRIAVTFSLQEVEEIERECAVYRGRMERIAKHSAVSREEQALRTEKARQELINQVRESAVKTLETHACRFMSSGDFNKRVVLPTSTVCIFLPLSLFDFVLSFKVYCHVLFVFPISRKELIAQYSRLSEEAARRERRALWRVQRMRLDDARTQFFMVDSAPFSPLEGIISQTTIQARPHWGPAVLPKWMQNQIGTEENLCQVEKGNPKPSPFGHPSKSNFVLGHYTPEEPQKTTVHGHQVLTGSSHKEPALQLAQDIGQYVPDVGVLAQPSKARSHSSDSHIKIGEHVSDVDTLPPACSLYGHSSDSHIKLGEHVSDVDTLPPACSLYGHSSDSHIKIGENATEFVPLVPVRNIHGHVSDAHILVGDLWSDIIAPVPPPSVYGHCSDAHIKVGENVSDVVALHPVPSIHGHSSDANIKLGEFVSNIPENQPRWSEHGHASDCILQPGCVVSGAEPPLQSLPGSSYGHSSDSALVIGCVVSGDEPKLSPLPGSEHGHSSDSHLGIGCVVSKTEPPPSHSCEQLEESPSHAFGVKSSSVESYEEEYISALSSHYQVEHYEDFYNFLDLSPESQLLKQVTRGPWGLPMEPTLRRSTDTTSVQLSEMVSLPVLIKHSVTAPLITHVSLVNKAVVDYFFVEIGVEKHFEVLRHFLLMEDGEFAQSLSDRLFEKMVSGQTPGELLTPLVLNSILSKALQYSLHGDTPLAANFTFALRFLPETFHPHAPDSLNCLELRYKVDWPLNIIITDSCMNKYNRLFSFLLQLKHMVWSLRDVWFHLKRTALVKGAGRSVQFRQLQLYRHEMQHFVKVIQGYIANQILQVSWSEFTAKLATVNDLDAIHRTHADYLNRAIFRGLLTDKAAPVMNIIHSIFSLILKFRAQLIAQPWDNQQGEAVHPSFIAMQQSYNTFKYYSHFLFKVVTKLVNRGYQPHLEDFLLRINFNNYYKDS
uniref:Gamma-tubulin complex component 6 n=2 Tax=Oryzias sinensis TaxID=183150 RepID=A0A8C7ZZA9_9TELE